MNWLIVNQLTVLLWKNFTLKKRQMISSVTEILAALVFVIMLLIFRALTDISVVGPYHFAPQPIATMPSFIKDAKEWELIYVPSDIDVVTEIIENVKKNLNTSIKVRGFPSEAEFEKYILFNDTSQKVLAAIVFDCSFKNKNDPLPLQVKYHLRFVGVQRTISWPEKIGWKITFLFPNRPSLQPRNPNFLDGGSPAHLVASAGNLLFFASFFPYNFISEHYEMLDLTSKVTACLSANVALALGINILIKLEIQEIGVKWHNLWTPANLEDNLIFGYMFGMLLFDAFLYSLVTWYVETVFPGQCGVPQPWYFFLMHSYWFGKPKIRKTAEETKYLPKIHNCFEAEPTNLVAGIQIKRLHKQFRNNPAINNLSLNVYEGQITVLLGHNGAGKSTILSILTGRFPATRGEAYINGYNISDNMTEIRKDLGFCPQHDLLFDDLTLSEHLFFYCTIKGIYQNINYLEIDHMLSIFNLKDNFHTLSGSMSGGVKRKLSIIIALTGCSKVVILDEPSSGMDPTSRRATWDILQHYKCNRTILLTTHYMDEADILGDRIAIMVRGTLHCCGSSVFLKQIYGAGYCIVMEKERHCDINNIFAMIQHHVPGAVLKNDLGSELSFILPKKYVSRFEALFTDLEINQKTLGIANFGASITTMEEVFLKVNNLAAPQRTIQSIKPYYLKYGKMRQDKQQNENVPRNYNTPKFPHLSEITTIKFNTGFPLYRQQFCSMFIKRALFIWRNWKLMLLQIIIVLVVTTYLLLALHLDENNIPEREMDLSHYGGTIVPYSISGNSDLALNLTKNLKIFLKSKNQRLRKIKGL